MKSCALVTYCSLVHANDHHCLSKSKNILHSDLQSVRPHLSTYFFFHVTRFSSWQLDMLGMKGFPLRLLHTLTISIMASLSSPSAPNRDHLGLRKRSCGARYAQANFLPPHLLHTLTISIMSSLSSPSPPCRDHLGFQKWSCGATTCNFRRSGIYGHLYWTAVGASTSINSSPLMTPLCWISFRLGKMRRMVTSGSTCGTSKEFRKMSEIYPQHVAYTLLRSLDK